MRDIQLEFICPGCGREGLTPEVTSDEAIGLVRGELKLRCPVCRAILAMRTTEAVLKVRLLTRSLSSEIEIILREQLIKRAGKGELERRLSETIETVVRKRLAMIVKTELAQRLSRTIETVMVQEQFARMKDELEWLPWVSEIVETVVQEQLTRVEKDELARRLFETIEAWFETFPLVLDQKDRPRIAEEEKKEPEAFTTPSVSPERLETSFSKVLKDSVAVIVGVGLIVWLYLYVLKGERSADALAAFSLGPALISVFFLWFIYWLFCTRYVEVWSGGITVGNSFGRTHHLLWPNIREAKLSTCPTLYLSRWIFTTDQGNVRLFFIGFTEAQWEYLSQAIMSVLADRWSVVGNDRWPFQLE